MSAPAFAWALERGATLKLPPAERLVLIYLADMANGVRICWPGQETIVKFTGLALRTVRAAIHKLADRQLIRVEGRPGVITRYHILRPDTPANGAWVDADHPGNPSQGKAPKLSTTPANGAGVKRGNPGKWCTGPRQMVPPTPANRPPDPSKTQERDPKPARARETGEAASGQRAEAAPSAAPARLDQEAPPPVVANGGVPTDLSPIVRAVAASIRGFRPPPEDPAAEHAPVRRGPVDPERTVEQQQAILAAMIAEEALVQASRGMVAAE